jgi:hypothetical protein
MSPSQGRHLHTEQHKHNKSTQTSMPCVGFEPTIPVFKPATTVHALDLTATVIGSHRFSFNLYSICSFEMVTDSYCLQMHFTQILNQLLSRGSAVDIVTILAGVRFPSREKYFVSTPQRLDRLWGLPSLLSNGYRGSFLGGKAAEARS